MHFTQPAGVTSFAGHIYGSFPPGRIGSVAGHARHMLCMLRAHTQAYELIKSMPGGLALPLLLMLLLLLRGKGELGGGAWRAGAGSSSGRTA